MECPSCKTKLSVFAHFDPESELTFVLHPKQGGLLSANTLGGALRDVDALMKAAAKEVDGKIAVFVRQISSDEAGSVTVKLNLLEVNSK